ncbi:MAG TPA: UDP-N-acetylmuramoyl-tripeptide--D-alanyl-D-alanine ligase [Candidatus Saccharimonadales bacterium]|nr:UDP-N-acetylmuramoyl-tripeptide--D-alanyl-D-alanine ligase [Candidatus Saccharimonadales bacterium]
MFRQLIQKRLERYVVKYFKKHPEVKLVVVAGSVGKTSTKRAIATLLSQRYRVAMHPGNHNTHMSVPLAILGIEYPGSIKSVGAWLSVFAAARRRINEPTGTDVIIAEIGADHPGDIAHFGTYLKPYIGIITAVTPEHMEFFNDIESVAKEELTAGNFSQIAIINRDDIEERFATFLQNPNVDTYGTTGVAEYRFETEDFEVETGYKGSVIAPEYQEPIAATIKVVGEHSLRPVMGAVAVASKMGLRPSEIAAGLALIRPVPGRMNILRGIDNTIVIDDTYNSSPVAASSALQTLYSMQAPQRIAILGSMNELGVLSAAEHEKLGALCDPTLLSWVITIGEEAEKYLAPAARVRGCQVRSFRSAIDAGAFARSVLEPGAVILAKGSQGNVYAEEAVKVLCVMTADDELVRQSSEWLATKEAFFSKFSA